jgi:hypothetical protein
VTVNVVLSDGPAPIVGGQFFLSYDTGKLTFIGADPPPVVWTTEIFESVDPAAGTVDYAVGIPNGGSGAVSGPMAILTFTATAEICSTAGLVTFRTHTPPTKIIDENNVSYTAGTTLTVHSLSAISIDSTAPEATTAIGAGDANLSCEDSAGLAAALAFVPEFSDNCSASVSAELVSDDTMPDGGGGYVRVRTWTSTDDCGNTSDPFVQTITVSNTCDDGNSCTVDTCVGGNCLHDLLPGSGSGDVNGDGRVNGLDIQGFITALLDGPTTPGYCAVDMNGDGEVTTADVPAFIAVLLAE